MARRLNTTVHVYDESGSPVVLVAGDTVPKKFRDQVTAEGIWQDDDGTASDESNDESPAHTSSEASTGNGSQTSSGAGSEEQQTSTEQQSGNGASSDSSSLVKPPVAGSGSGRDPWFAYAKGLGLAIADDANKADILEAVKVHEDSKAQA